MTDNSNFVLSRRDALKLIGVGGVSGVLGYSRFKKPQPTIHERNLLDLPRSLDSPKSVVVIGGGLAGLASAYELTKRGFQVTLLEKSPQLGGKIASWEIQVGDDKFRMEHGFHGFFPQYYNLKSIVSELNIEDNFKSLEFYAVAFRDNNYQPEIFRPSNTAFPWNIVDLAIASPNRFRWGINLTNFKHLEVFHAITGFKIPKTYETYDHLTLAEWAKEEFPQGLYDLYFLPFAKSSLNAPDTLSLGELLQFFHFYFFGNPEGLAFNGTVDDMGTSLVNPIAQYILDHGGRIVTEANVSEITYINNQIDSVSYFTGNNGDNVPFWIDKNELLSTEKDSFYGAGDRLFIAPSSQENNALSLTCTHQGCTVQKQIDGKFVCPCHGAVYDSNGKIISGPAKRDLPQYKITKTNKNQAQLIAKTANLESNIPATINADYYVIATDVPGVKHLFNLMSGDLNPEIKDKIAQLALSDPFAVGRFWLDQDFEWEESWFTSLSGYALTDSITLYHRIQNQFIEWHKKTGGSVVELHAYCYKEKEFPTQESLLNTFEQELYEIVPSLKSAKILHKELVNQKNFSGYPPNSFNSRPESQSEIPNLVFAGDWVKMPFPCGLMERAVSSGLLAANQILTKEGLQKRELLSVNPEGLLKI